MLSNYIIHKISNYLDHVTFKNGIYYLQSGFFIRKKIDEPMIIHNYIIDIKKENDITCFLSHLHEGKNFILKLITDIIFGFDDEYVNDGRCMLYDNIYNGNKLLKLIHKAFNQFTDIANNSLFINIYHVNKWKKKSKIGGNFEYFFKNWYIMNVIDCYPIAYDGFMIELAKTVLYDTDAIPDTHAGIFSKMICNCYTKRFRK